MRDAHRCLNALQRRDPFFRDRQSCIALYWKACQSDLTRNRRYASLLTTASFICWMKSENLLIALTPALCKETKIELFSSQYKYINRWLNAFRTARCLTDRVFRSEKLSDISFPPRFKWKVKRAARRKCSARLTKESSCVNKVFVLPTKSSSLAQSSGIQVDNRLEQEYTSRMGMRSKVFLIIYFRATPCSNNC